MNINTIKSRLQVILPFEASALILEEVALQSSYIPFNGIGEYLFRKGDNALGFYWVLAGEVEVIIPGKRSIRLKAGDMVGLDSFIEDEPIPFDILSSSSKLECIFIDRRCYNSMREHSEFNRYMNQMVMNCLRNYRVLLIPEEKVYF